MVKCDTCPWSKDLYPGELHNGVPFRICGMTGNIVYPVPHREKRYSGSGYINFEISTCNMWKDEEDVLNHMHPIERERYLREKGLKKDEKDGANDSGEPVKAVG
jgi:hypothetical protein